MADDAALPHLPRAPSPEPLPVHPRIRRVEAVVNPLSGSVGPGAGETLERLLSEHGLAARVCEATARDLSAAVRAAVDAAPDLVVILAGDGTAAMAARRAGPDGPLVAPLPGGTMNMLPHAIYGQMGWQAALSAALTVGEARPVSGGEVDGHAFYVAAILGAPTLWARAREAMRKGRMDLAIARARTAISRTFTGALHYELDDGSGGEAEALSLLCPLISRRVHEEVALEAAALDPKGAADLFRLGFNALTSDWRNDPSVKVHVVTQIKAWARGRIPATLDGEPIRLPREVEVKFLRQAFRTLAPRAVNPATDPRLMARLIQLSDIHFGGENAPATEAALQYALDWKPDLTLVTGDVTLNGLPREFQAAKTFLNRLPNPWLCTPGNHDTPYWNLILRAATPFARYRHHIGPAFGEKAAVADAVVQTINTARGAQPRLDWSKGAINLEVCHQTVEQMAGSGAGTLRFVACHHPLIEATGAPVTGGVHRGDEAAAILAHGGIDAIFTGHVHNPFAVPLACADGKTYAIGAGTLSLRVRGTPPGFNRVCTSDDTITVEAMGWTGSHFEPYRTWALPRRQR